MPADVPCFCGQPDKALEEVQKGLAQGAVVDHLAAQAAVGAYRELTASRQNWDGGACGVVPHDSDLTGRLNRALRRAAGEDGTLDTLASSTGSPVD